jgi:hypothetical protein
MNKFSDNLYLANQAAKNRSLNDQGIQRTILNSLGRQTGKQHSVQHLDIPYTTLLPDDFDRVEHVMDLEEAFQLPESLSDEVLENIRTPREMSITIKNHLKNIKQSSYIDKAHEAQRKAQLEKHKFQQTGTIAGAGAGSLLPEFTNSVEKGLPKYMGHTLGGAAVGGLAGMGVGALADHFHNNKIKKAAIRGFSKRAAEKGFTEEEIDILVKKAFGMENVAQMLEGLKGFGKLHYNNIRKLPENFNRFRDMHSLNSRTSPSAMGIDISTLRPTKQVMDQGINRDFLNSLISTGGAAALGSAGLSAAALAGAHHRSQPYITPGEVNNTNNLTGG